MRAATLTFVLTLLGSLVSPGAAPAGNLRLQGRDLFDLVPLAEGLFAVIKRERVPGLFTSNSAVIINQDNVVVVDADGWPTAARALIAEIGKLTDKPVRTVIITHASPDHAQATGVYRENFPAVEIIAHVNTRESIRDDLLPFLQRQRATLSERLSSLEDDLNNASSEPERVSLARHLAWLSCYAHELQDLEIVLPTAVFENRIILHRGGREIHLLATAGGHTLGDVVVYLPRERVLLTGDLIMSDRTFPGGYFPDRYLQSLRQLQQLDFDILVPGHGPLLHGKEFLNLQTELAESLIAQVKAAVAAGKSLPETQAWVKLGGLRARFVERDAAFGSHFDRETARALETAYQQLSGRP